MLAFGPVPSRRLGYSLGVNHIPPKHCPYACVYCQVGRTTTLEIERRAFYPVAEVVAAAAEKLAAAAQAGRVVDYLTLVPDGEPTLDRHLGALIRALRALGPPVAVIANSALIDRPEVQDDLLAADWVSLKVDAVTEAAWRAVNRPQGRLDLPAILDGMRVFRRRFTGTLATETLLVAGVNDHEADFAALLAFLDELRPDRAYLSLPTRPPAETWVAPPPPETLARLLALAAAADVPLEPIFEAEAADFQATGDLRADILAITAVHPLREAALRGMAGDAWPVVEALLAAGQLFRLSYRGEVFYLRRTPNRRP